MFQSVFPAIGAVDRVTAPILVDDVIPHLHFVGLRCGIVRPAGLKRAPGMAGHTSVISVIERALYFRRQWPNRVDHRFAGDDPLLTDLFTGHLGVLGRTCRNRVRHQPVETAVLEGGLLGGSGAWGGVGLDALSLGGKGSKGRVLGQPCELGEIEPGVPGEIEALGMLPGGTDVRPFGGRKRGRAGTCCDRRRMTEYAGDLACGSAKDTTPGCSGENFTRG
jgi:hypothetical protein